METYKICYQDGDDLLETSSIGVGQLWGLMGVNADTLRLLIERHEIELENTRLVCRAKSYMDEAEEEKGGKAGLWETQAKQEFDDAGTEISAGDLLTVLRYYTGLEDPHTRSTDKPIRHDLDLIETDHGFEFWSQHYGKVEIVREV